MADNKIEIIVVDKAALEAVVATIQQGFDDINARMDAAGIPKRRTVKLPSALAHEALKSAVTRPPAPRRRRVVQGG